jgi:uncharacterized phage protein gp47/JayE
MSEIDCSNGCRQTGKYTPIKIYNPAGLSIISYRVGKFSQFKADMLTSIASQKKLKDLTTREDSDLSIGILDSWAMVADILSFYQERIANEGFLKTATERRSILELARSIGYELKPGIAARGYLAFTMDPLNEFPNKRRTTTINVGTKVQSIPAQNETPQIFETIEKIEATDMWNEIRPRRVKNQDLRESLKKGLVIFDGTSTKLKNGDGLLFIINKIPVAFVLTTDVMVDAEKKLTRVSFDKIDSIRKNKSPKDPPIKYGTSIIDLETSFDEQDLEYIVKKQWTESALQGEAELNGWSVDVIVDAVNAHAKKKNENMTYNEVYALRVKCGVFGNNAPRWLSLPLLQRMGEKAGASSEPPKQEKVYPINWDDHGKNVNVNTDTNVNPDASAFNNYTEADIYLDNIYPNVQPDSWVVLQDSEKYFAYQTTRISERTLLGFSLTAKVTGVKLERRALSGEGTINTLNLDKFGFRQTTVYIASEKLVLAESPIEQPVEGDSIILEKMVGNLQVGRPITITGELYNQPGTIQKEISFIKEVIHFDSRISYPNLLTNILLSEKLAYKYKPETVKINMNVAEVTHGESKQEAIGSGNPLQKFQNFVLKQKPLTYIPASTPSGTISTLEISVNGVKWQEVDSLLDGLKPTDKVFVARRNNEGETLVFFGNGINSRLPPTGQENIKARYRIGIGTNGNLAADQLTILMTRPLGARYVTNPLKVTGGTDPEKLDDARTNAPRTVLTLDRIVSLEDFKNFARGFAGIGKATSYVVRMKDIDVVLVAVASTEGGKITKALHTDLEKAIDSIKDPVAQFTLRSFISRKFDLGAKVKISIGMDFESIKQNVEKALNKAFSFNTRDFGQGVTRSEVISTIQEVEGIEGVDLEYLYEHSMSKEQIQEVENLIPAKGEPDPNIKDEVIIPSLLLVNNEGIKIMEMEA